MFEKLNSKVYQKLQINFGFPKLQLQKDKKELKIVYPNLHLQKKIENRILNYKKYDYKYI